MTTSARPSSTVRGVALVSLLAVAAFATFMISPALGGTTSNLVAVEALAPDLAVHLGIYGGAAVAIWDAFMSPWAMALVPLGFGSWAVVLRLTFQTLVRQLGKQAARKAALNF